MLPQDPSTNASHLISAEVYEVILEDPSDGAGASTGTRARARARAGTSSSSSCVAAAAATVGAVAARYFCQQAVDEIKPGLQSLGAENGF